MLGDSRARWEGDELVVETTNLTDKTSIGLNGNGLRHSDKMTITERFKRVADDVIQYQITIDDPVTYVRPFTLSLPLTPLEGNMLLPYDCHEGNLAHPAVARRRARRGSGARKPISSVASSARAGRCRTAIRRPVAAAAGREPHRARPPQQADVLVVRRPRAIRSDKI